MSKRSKAIAEAAALAISKGVSASEALKNAINQHTPTADTGGTAAANTSTNVIAPAPTGRMYVEEQTTAPIVPAALVTPAATTEEKKNKMWIALAAGAGVILFLILSGKKKKRR